MSTRRSSLTFGAAMVASNLAQAAWLIAGARVFSDTGFGTALTAQAMYGVLQIVVDNGAGFHGARLAARRDLEAQSRNELAHARLLLALVGSVAGLLIASVGGGTLLLAFAPFTAGLCLFAVLNIWEPYGEGRVLPYAIYLVLRSVVLAVVVGAFAIIDAGLPVAAVGLCEVAAVTITGIGFAQWLLPRGASRVRRRTWRSLFDIGFPALITQYNFAVTTIVLGVSGRTSAAAVSGVTFRLLSGVQGVNGAAVAAIFPRLARSKAPEGGDLRASRLAAWGIVAVSYLAVLATAIAAPLLVFGFLATSAEAEQATLVLGAGGAASAGLVMHQSFSLLARGLERRLLRSFAMGAAVITLAAAVAAISGGEGGLLIAAGGFVVGQVLTLSLLFRGAATGGEERRANRALLAVAGGVIPCIAVALALSGEHRIWIAATLAAISAVIAAANRTSWLSAPAPRTETNA